MHLSTFLHPKCPAPFQRTFARRTFDRALRSLPPSLHGRIWGLYLRWAEQVGGIVGDRVWRRLLKVGCPGMMLSRLGNFQRVNMFFTGRPVPYRASHHTSPQLDTRPTSRSSQVPPRTRSQSHKGNVHSVGRQVSIPAVRRFPRTR